MSDKDNKRRRRRRRRRRSDDDAETEDGEEEQEPQADEQAEPDPSVEDSVDDVDEGQGPGAEDPTSPPEPEAPIETQPDDPSLGESEADDSDEPSDASPGSEPLTPADQDDVAETSLEAETSTDESAGEEDADEWFDQDVEPLTESSDTEPVADPDEADQPDKPEQETVAAEDVEPETDSVDEEPEPEPAESESAADAMDELETTDEPDEPEPEERVIDLDEQIETTDKRPLKQRLLLWIINATAALITKWENIRGRSYRDSLDTYAASKFSRYFRNREEEFREYQQQHVKARIERDWDVQLSVAVLVTSVATVGTLVLSLPLLIFGVGLSPVVSGLLSVLLTMSTAIFGYYWYMSWKLEKRIYQRRREIDKLLPQAVAYMFSHSQGQQTVPEIIESLAREEDTYGAISEEFGIVHKEVDIFESDLRSALRQARETTPSENLSAFFDELINVIDMTGDLTNFLEEKTSEYHDRSLTAEERFIGRLEYVSFGFSFFGNLVPVIAILIVVFLSVRGSEVVAISYWTISIYVVLVAVGAYIVTRVLSIDDMHTTRTLDTSHKGAEIDDINDRLAQDTQTQQEQRDSHATAVATDGGLHSYIKDPRSITSRAEGHTAPLSERERSSLLKFRRALKIDGWRRALNNISPLLKRRPHLTLVGTVPVACLFAAITLLTGIASFPAPGSYTNPIWDLTFVYTLPLFIVLGPLWYYSRQHRQHDKTVRENLPNMLRKLSSATEAGTPLVESIKAVGETADDELTQELRYSRNELSTFFTDLDDVLIRMANRVRNPRLTRVTTLLVEANTSSGNVQDILQVTAQDAEAAKRLDRKRYSKMETYMMTIVGTFGAFLIIAAVFQFELLPHLSETLEHAGDIDQSRISFFPTIDADSLTLLLYYTTIVVGLCSGLIAGKFGYDDVRAGAGWAFLMVLSASLIFWFAAI